MLDQVRLCYFI